MNLDETISQLGLTDFRDALTPSWPASQAALPPTGPFFLRPAFVAAACEAAFLPAEPMVAALAGAERIAARPALATLAWYFYWCLWESPTFDQNQKSQWPALAQVPAELAGDLAMIYLLAMLARYPQMEEVHRAHDVSRQIAEHTLMDIQLGGWTALHEQYGEWGLDRPRLHWLSYHFRGEIYRLGRLQFQYGPFHAPLRVFQHRETGKILALSQSGVRYLADGRLWSESREAEGVAQASKPASGAGDSQAWKPALPYWTAELTSSSGKSEDPSCALCGAIITGHPITARGLARREPAELTCTEWWQVLAPGDPVLHLHIPVGGPMDHAECGESMRWAAQWFPEHFPEWPYEAYCCNSWLLDTQLQEFLPPESNIARFQREMYLFPTITSDQNLLGPIFECMPEFTAATPRKTALQRALGDYLEAGNKLRASGGGCFILKDDLDWGGEVYLRGKALYG